MGPGRKVEVAVTGPAGMRGLWIVLVVLLASTTGCLSGSTIDVEIVSTDREPEQRAEDEILIARLHGNETREAVEGEPSHGVCDVAFSHRLDVANRTLTYDGGRYEALDPNQTWGLLATEHWDEATFCPIAYALHTEPDEGVEVALGEAENVTVALHEDGRLVVQGRTVEQGEAARVTYSYESSQDGTVYRHEGAFTVEVLGAWSTGNVTAEPR